MPVLSASGVTVSEGNSGLTNLTFTLTLDVAPSAPVTLGYYVQGDTASDGTGDYYDEAGTLQFDTGESSITVTISVRGDALVESAERFRLVLTDIAGATFHNNAAALSVVGTILNDDGGATGSAGSTAMTHYNGPASAHATLPTLTVANTSMFEGNSGLQYVRWLVTLDKAPTAPVTFSYYIQDGSASTQLGDYYSDSGNVTIEAGQRSTYIYTQVIGDLVSESNETMQLVLTDIAGGVFQNDAPALIATGTIIDDDSGAPSANGGIGTAATNATEAPSAHATLPTLNVQNVSVHEGNSGLEYVRFLVTLDKAPTAPVTFYFAVLDGSASEGDGDFYGGYDSVTFTAGQTSGWIQTQLIGDVRNEGNETLRVLLTDLSGAVFAGNASALLATGTILDDDDGTPNQTGGVGSNATQLFGPDSAHATLPTIQISNASAFEGNSGSSYIYFLVTLDKASTAPVTFDYYISGATANSDVDFDDFYGTVTFAAGERSTWIRTAIYGDVAIEGNETFQLVGVNAQGAVFAGGVPALIATGTIIDNDTGTISPTDSGIGTAALPVSGPASSHPTLPTITVQNASALEDNGSSTQLRFLVTLDKASTAPVSFDYFIQDGTASEGLGDYYQGSGTVTIAAGETSGWLEVTILGDTTIETNETIRLVLSGATGGVFSGNAPVLVATGTIIEDDNGSFSAPFYGVGDIASRAVAAPDALGVPVVRIVSTSVNEGNSGSTEAGVYILLSHASASAVTIQYQTIAGTAQSGTPADYYTENGTITIQAGETSAFIGLTVLGDTLIEGDESFSLQFTNMTGGVFEGGGLTSTATILIRDNESGTAGAASGPQFVLSPNGTSGADVLNGTPSNEALYGAGGNDIINGRGGADTLDGGPGIDTVTYADATSPVNVSLAILTVQNTGGGGFDILGGIENLIGTAGHDTLTGNALANKLEGGGGNDILNGGIGADILEGGLGNDIFYVDNAGDTATDLVNGGTDTVSASRSWAVASNIEQVVLTGTGDFNVAGNGLDNVLRGNSGDNWINGSFGKDKLTGGGGRDSFIFNRALGPNNIDTITDYDVVRDVIRIDNAVFSGIGAAGALAAGAFNTGVAATQADDRIIYDPATGRLYFDIDGVGGAAQQHFATLSTKPAGMTAGEFIII